MRDCVGIISGVQHIDGTLQVKYWGVRTRVTPAALTPICVQIVRLPSCRLLSTQSMQLLSISVPHAQCSFDNATLSISSLLSLFSVCSG